MIAFISGQMLERYKNSFTTIKMYLNPKNIFDAILKKKSNHRYYDYTTINWNENIIGISFRSIVTYTIYIE